MKITAFDRDEILTGFLSDYLDNRLEYAELSAFREYLNQNRDEKKFVRKAKKGKEVLERFRNQVAKVRRPAQ